MRSQLKVADEGLMGADHEVADIFSSTRVDTIDHCSPDKQNLCEWQTYKAQGVLRLGHHIYYQFLIASTPSYIQPTSSFPRLKAININLSRMKTSQILAAGAALTGYVQACTRIKVDQVHIQPKPFSEIADSVSICSNTCH